MQTYGWSVTDTEACLHTFNLGHQTNSNTLDVRLALPPNLSYRQALNMARHKTNNLKKLIMNLKLN